MNKNLLQTIIGTTSLLYFQKPTRPSRTSNRKVKNGANKKRPHRKKSRRTKRVKKK